MIKLAKFIAVSMFVGTVFASFCFGMLLLELWLGSAGAAAVMLVSGSMLIGAALTYAAS